MDITIYPITSDDIFAAVRAIRDPKYVPKEFKAHHKIRPEEILHAVRVRHGDAAANALQAKTADIRILPGYRLTVADVERHAAKQSHPACFSEASDAAKEAIAAAVAEKFGVAAGLQYVTGRALVDILDDNEDMATTKLVPLSL